jgi:hypothetical protein
MGMARPRAARIASSPDASSHGDQTFGSGGSAELGATTARQTAAGRQGGRAAAKSKS